MGWSVAGAFGAAVPKLFGRAEDEKYRFGEVPQYDGLRRRRVVPAVFVPVCARALPLTAEDPISSKVPRGRPHFGLFTFFNIQFLSARDMAL